MSFKTPLLCDRRVYDKRGKWKNPNQDISDIIFYFVKTPRTLVPSWENGREVLTETMTIVVFGGKPIVKGDYIELETGEKFQVASITANYFEPNILVKDMLKPRIESLEIELD